MPIKWPIKFPLGYVGAVLDSMTPWDFLGYVVAVLDMYGLGDSVGRATIQFESRESGLKSHLDSLFSMKTKKRALSHYSLCYYCDVIL